MIKRSAINGTWLLVVTQNNIQTYLVMSNGEMLLVLNMKLVYEKESSFSLK